MARQKEQEKDELNKKRVGENGQIDHKELLLTSTR